MSLISERLELPKEFSWTTFNLMKIQIGGKPRSLVGCAKTNFKDMCGQVMQQPNFTFNVPNMTWFVIVPCSIYYSNRLQRISYNKNHSLKS
ncbi:hypothetical protein VIGAN_06255800 [Vigna angularis var. angularis]|uniref:Uncharacterized protein n=1 Tax=Vigna angularis var. angularis TaxID=157739 RepID=A0A0S3SEJ3_PHAAN|nr:hypothetical protein VIGAN_06255800 [Vigna angularis var. angularis]